MRGRKKRAAWPAGWVIAAGLMAGGCAGTMRDGPATVNYVPDASYHLLMAEIALQREAWLTAAQEYLTAAEQGADSTIARRATEYAFDFGYDQFALRSAARWLELEPDSTGAHEFLARLQLRRREYAAAAEHYGEALGPADLRGGDDYLALESELADEPDALGVLRVLLRLDPGVAPPAGYQVALARAALRAGAFELALESARRASAAGDGYQSGVLEARARFALGDVDAAVGQMAELARSRQLLGLELEYVRLLAASGDLDGAADVLTGLAARYRARPELLRMYALLSLGADNVEAAAFAFERLLESGYEVYEAFFYLGEIAVAEERYEDAVGYYGRIGTGAYFVPAQVRIADAYRRAGYAEDGLAHLDGFAAAYPRSAAEVLEARAQFLQLLGRDDEAVALYAEGLNYRPRAIELLVGRAIVLERLGRLDAALADMARAVDIAPDDAAALNTYGYTLANRTRRHEEAYAHIRLALELDPSSPPILDSMGWVLHRLGRDELALSYLEQAHRLLDDPEIAAHLGEVLWQSGDPDEARRIWTDALDRFPDSEPLLETVERLLDE